MRLIEIQTKKPGVLNLTWILNNICTNSCSYCDPILYNGKNHHYEWKHAKEFIQELNTRYDKIDLSISGGEPTLSPFLLDLCKQIGGDIHITTNGMSSLRKYEELSEYVWGWSFSWHPEFQQEGWLDKVSYISKISNVTVRIMAPANQMETVSSFLTLINSEKRNFRYEIVKIQPRGHIDVNTLIYSKESENILRTPVKMAPIDQRNFITTKKHIFHNLSNDNIGTDATYIFAGDVDVYKYFQKDHISSNDIIKHGFTDYRGWKCNVGLESLFVQFDGSIKRGNCEVGGNIGTIQDIDNIQWPTTPIICTSSRCDCNPDIRVTKKIGPEEPI
jgi:Radical SAM superfamily/4Fe-4S single cluster domain